MARRLLGFVSALSALLLLAAAALWVRSYTFETEMDGAVCLNGSHHWAYLSSFAGRLGYYAWVLDGPPYGSSGEAAWRRSFGDGRRIEVFGFGYLYAPTLPPARAGAFLRWQIPYWFIAAACGLLPLRFVILAKRRQTSSRRQARGLCAACGYNLRGNASGICPECGIAMPQLALT